MERQGLPRSWSAAGARASCLEQLAHVDDDDSCGSWTAVHYDGLPDDRQGRKRFLVEAIRTQYAGMTVGNELAVWSAA